MFWVADDGAGVPKEELPRLFDRFWQATSSDRRGAGLGLSIVKGIVDLHGGRVWVESEVGVGTTFYFTLPVARSDQLQLGQARRWRARFSRRAEVPRCAAGSGYASVALQQSGAAHE
jgi:hypothetical protein